MGLQQARYLVLEDSRIDQIMLSNFMDKLGICRGNVSFSPSLEEIPDKVFDFILCDLNLKDSSSLDTVRCVHQKFPDTVLIVFTVLEDLHLATKAIHMGAQDYLIKGKFDAMLLEKTLLFANERSNLARQVKNNEVRFRGLIEHNHDAILIMDEETNITYASPSTKSILGYLPNEVTGKKAFDFLHPEDKPKREEIFRHLLDRETSIVVIKERILHKNGNYIWIEATITDHRNVPGIWGIVSNSKNIDQEERALERLRQSEKRLQDITDTIPGLVLRYQLFPDGTDKVLYASKGQDEMWGVPRVEAIEDTTKLWGVVHEEDIESMKISFLQSARELSFWDYKYRIYARDGLIRWVNCRATPTRQPDNSVIWDAIFLDITEQVKMEQALKQSHERFELVGKATNDAIWDWNLKTDELYCGQGFEKSFGYEIENDLMNIEFWSSKIHPLDKEKVLNGIESTLIDPGISYWKDEFRFIKFNGDIAYVHCKAFIIFDEYNTPIRMVGAMQDVTEKRKLLIDISKRNKELSCLFSISQLVNDSSKTKPEILKVVLSLLSGSWQYQEIACSRIKLNGFTYASKNFKKSPWSQKAEIISKTRCIGFVEVNYLQQSTTHDEGPFLKEERELINTIAELLGNMIEKRDAEDWLAKERILLRTVIDNIPDRIYVKNKNFEYVISNKANVKFIGVRNEKETLGKTCLDLLDGCSCIEDDCQVLGCGKILMITDHVVTSKKGITRRFHTTKAPIKDSSGKTIGIVGISRDITQSKEAEEKLLESEANIKRAATNMKALLDNTEDAYVLVDKNFCIVTFNNQAAKNAKKLQSKRLIIGENFLDYVPKPKEAMKLAVLKALAGEKVDYMQTYLMNGEEVSMLIKVHPIIPEDGEIIEVSIVARDITERKLYEKELIFQQQLLSNTQQLANLGNFEWDLHSNVFYATDDFFQLMDIKPGSANLHQEFLNKIQNGDRFFVKEAFKEAIKKKTPFSLEFKTIPINDKHKYFKGKGIISTNIKGKATKMFFALQDISDQKTADQAMVMGQELERDRLAKDLHDDIGQLLTATKFRLEAIRPDGSKKQAEQLNRVKELLVTTIKEVRYITKNLSTKVLEQQGLKAAIVELCRPFHETDNYQVLIEYDLAFQLDHKLQLAIYRIIQETVNNVIKHASANLIEVKLHEKKDHISLEINDNGIGFNINDTVTCYGNGLLNIKERVNLFRGSFTIASNMNEGTRINCKFPK